MRRAGSAESGSGGQDTPVVIVNEQPDGAGEVTQRFGERERLAHQTGTTLAEGGIETFQMIGLTTAFWAGTMAFGRQDSAVGR